jgi:transcriptional regulator
LLQIVSRLTDRHEQGRSKPWSVADAPADYLDGMLRAIVGIRLPIARLQGARKLSQNRSAQDIAGVRDGLGASPDYLDNQLAAHMRQL